jgi:hypothetical protein
MASYAKIIDEFPKDMQLPMMKLISAARDELYMMKRDDPDRENILQKHNEIIKEFPEYIQDVMMSFLEVLREEILKAFAENEAAAANALSELKLRHAVKEHDPKG